jgi:hypothetical protein
VKLAAEFGGADGRAAPFRDGSVPAGFARDGIVKLLAWAKPATRPREVDGRRSRGSGAADLGPDPEGTRPGRAVPDGCDVIAAEMEEVVDLVVGGEEALRLAR